ncbi:TlpA disulfide reductase family protein [Shewanella sp. GXUN23E]|uniref:TlpA disulfide reductase family protein n=1 Tax=Shewanella sp. GXUN23E TaxID=3422498 RepID=UPI003D7DDE99
MKWMLGMCMLCWSLATIAAPSLDVQVQDAQGQPVSLSEFNGKVVYLDFWASWCGPCRKSFPWMAQMQAKYGSEGLVVVAVNLDPEQQDAAQFLSQLAGEGLNVNFAVRYDPEGKVARQFDLLGMPSSYIFNRRGELVAQHTGFFTAKEAAYEQQLADLLKE